MQIMRDEVGASKGFGFVQYDSFESSDMAIECMNGQFLCNQPIVVQYAFKKESKGERHGSLAGTHGTTRPHMSRAIVHNYTFCGVCPAWPSGDCCVALLCGVRCPSRRACARRA